MGAAASSSASRPRAEATPCCASSRYQEGTRVLLMSTTKRAPTEDYVWVKAEVVSIVPHVFYMREGTLREGMDLHMREAGGRGEQYEQVVPYQTNKTTNSNASTPVRWDCNKKAPVGFGEDLLASVFGFLSPRELSALFPPPCSTGPETITLLNKKSRRHKQTRRKSGCRVRAIGGDATSDSPLSPITPSSALPSTTGGGLFAGATFGSTNAIEEPAGSETTEVSEERGPAIGRRGRRGRGRRVVPSVASLFGGSSVICTSTGEGGLATAAAPPGGGTASLFTFGATTPASQSRPPHLIWNKPVSTAPAPASSASLTTTTTTTAPVDLFGGSIQTQSGSLFAPAKAPTASRPPTASRLDKASTKGRCGGLFGAEAALGGESLFGGVGPTGSIFGGTGMTASSLSSGSGASLSTGGSRFGEAAFAQRSTGSVTESSESPVYMAALHQQTHVAIHPLTDDDRHFWENMTPEEAFGLGRGLVNLTALSLVQPSDNPLWCLDSMIAIVEGQAAGRGEVCKKEGQQHMAEGSLETIHFTTTTTSTTTTTATTTSNRPPIPPSFTNSPPTLHALKAVTGALPQHDVLVNTGWKMPALECVEQVGWGARTLGRFISSSQSLKAVSGSRFSWWYWAAVFRRIPEAPAGQPGPLRQLERIGALRLDTEGARQLQDLLTSRGCQKSLTGLDVHIPPSMQASTLPDLLAIDDLINMCCVSSDVPITVTSTPSSFDLAVFYADALPPRPSPFVKAAMQEAARRATKVRYSLTNHDITHPIDNPTQAAIDIASSLSFERAERVTVERAAGVAIFPGTPSPAPAIISHLQPFPNARELRIGLLGSAAGRLLAQKMPMQMGKVGFRKGVSREERDEVLDGLGSEREVAAVAAGEDLTENPFGVWGSATSPSIHNIRLDVEVPEFSDAAVLAHDLLWTLLTAGVPGLTAVQLWLAAPYDDMFGTVLRQVLPNGMQIGGFDVTISDGLGVFVVEATRLS
ncbi:unnamed protein product [Vitrella brassicaformis CCMP3155]|uniref:Uncharacterized protein n=1 Tax=Vitrella brassicaformis (strain CCMP3155) TaxID=1169540 RepID=A0A0G4GBX5_VITBC|nr:unnamed protein product [Vitrella brassicaformis CCMP3155]|eukprot:CEM26342.1 unnamed protein product [Vitrella brassicaformis CCMP3155]